MKKEVKEKRRITYFDSQAYLTYYTYEEYVNECHEFESEPGPENGEDYWDWVNRRIDEDWECFANNVCLNMPGDPVMLSGTLGLWNGTPEIRPELFRACSCDSHPLVDAVGRCIPQRCEYEMEVYLEGGVVYVEVRHHDGANRFEIRKLSDQGANVLENALDRDGAVVPKRYWFRSFGRFLY